MDKVKERRSPPMMDTGTRAMSGDDRQEIDREPDAGPGRPGQVIRLHPKTRERHMDWLAWGLATAGDEMAPRPIHARAETVTELPMFAEAVRLPKISGKVLVRAFAAV
jgi:putative SOS response-associated peptidase YedK